MTKVTSTKTLHWPKLNWGINAGEERELPEDKDAQSIILEHENISAVGNKTSKSSAIRDDEQE